MSTLRDVRRHAEMQAVAARGLGHGDEERAWLDHLALIERAETATAEPEVGWCTDERCVERHVQHGHVGPYTVAYPTPDSTAEPEADVAGRVVTNPRAARLAHLIWDTPEARGILASAPAKSARPRLGGLLDEPIYGPPPVGATPPEEPQYLLAETSPADSCAHVVVVNLVCKACGLRIDGLPVASRAEVTGDEREALAYCISRDVGLIGLTGELGGEVRAMIVDRVLDLAGFRRSPAETTRTEWGVRYPDGSTYAMRDRDNARYLAARPLGGQPRSLMRREVGEWAEEP